MRTGETGETENCANHSVFVLCLQLSATARCRDQAIQKAMTVIPREPVDYDHFSNILNDYRKTPLLMTLRDIDGHLGYFKHLDQTSRKLARLIRSASLRIEINYAYVNYNFKCPNQVEGLINVTRTLNKY